ncbi:hypothetical protein [Psychrobium sp. 1_MG-2023]|uniref:hypothetical protein n=1 Tax=Psychrobium sp. 1_MG-2023 TaxID=3062624 RepID=UPI000C344DD0|nr:hypothetical protein [Psychrobium sp. 1_MG-2023]MDP2561745.1 hypothetical protein [Psychrobium sp. 1_MG-2023]PKF59766.1 hypothetical protein CW748_00785 [Alteromonadales bacterium alter-6D02]
MIDIRELVESGDFFSVNAEDPYGDAKYARIKVENLYKLNWEDIDGVNEVEDIDIGANIWIMDITVVNLNKKKISADQIKDLVKLVDEEEFEFDIVEDSHLCGYSDYAKTSGLNKLYHTDLKPKIAKKGALAFELPDGFEELSLKIEDGTICEI